MPTKRVNGESNSRRARPPAMTPEGREMELQALAYDLAERQLREGTASAQVITHFLKSTTERDRLERERLQQQNLLDQARIQQISENRGQSELLREAIAAFTVYSGKDVSDDEEY